MSAPIADVPWRTLQTFARRLTITHQVTGEEQRWEPTDVQIAHWRNTAQHKRTNTLKPRQVYITTAQLLEDALFLARNTKRGHRIEVWLIWDTDDKVAEKVAVIGDFLSQMDIKHRATKNLIEVDRGRRNGRALRPSVVRGFTAGAKRTGASLTAHLVHASELPYWMDPKRAWLSLQPAVAFGRLRLETTMAAGIPLARRIWDVPGTTSNLFLSVEMQAAYRADPAGRIPGPDGVLRPPLRPDVEERLRAEGFTRRDTMTWLQWALDALAGGDWIELLREYPLTPEHCFNLAAGRWIRCRPLILPHRYVGLPDGGHLCVFIEPADTSGQLVIGVDTAGAKGRSRHAVAVIDKLTKKLVASYVSGTDTHRELANVVAYAQRLYTRQPLPHWSIVAVEGEPPEEVPLAVVESNGPGEATVTLCRERGVYVRDVRTTDASGYLGLLEVKHYAETGVLKGPEELTEEADSLRMEQKTEDSSRKWLGLKDLSMACGLCYVHIKGAPFEEEEEPKPAFDRTRFNFDERLGAEEG